MRKENEMRPQGQFPLGIEPDVVLAADEIVKEHARTYEQRMFEDTKKVLQGFDLISAGLVLAILGGGVLFQAVKQVAESESDKLAEPTPIVRYGEMQSIRQMSELYCSTKATATTTENYLQCVEEQIAVRVQRNEKYSQAPRPTPLP